MQNAKIKNQNSGIRLLADDFLNFDI